MEKLAALWNVAPLGTALGALIVVALAIAGVLRLRAARSAARSPAPMPPAESDQDAVDSSHIGFAPLVSDAPHQRFDAGKQARGEDSPGGRE